MPQESRKSKRMNLGKVLVGGSRLFVRGKEVVHAYIHVKFKNLAGPEQINELYDYKFDNIMSMHV